MANQNPLAPSSPFTDPLFYQDIASNIGAVGRGAKNLPVFLAGGLGDLAYMGVNPFMQLAGQGVPPEQSFLTSDYLAQIPAIQSNLGPQEDSLPFLAGKYASPFLAAKLPDAAELLATGAMNVAPRIGSYIDNVLSQDSALDQMLQGAMQGGGLNVLDPRAGNVAMATPTDPPDFTDVPDRANVPPEVDLLPDVDVPPVDPLDGVGLQSPKLAEATLGQYKSTTAGRIMNMTKKNQGYSVNLGTGDTIDAGSTHAIMMGKFRNDDPRNTVIDGPITQKAIKEFVEKNKKVLAKEGNYLGTWYDSDTNKTYLDVSQRFEETTAGIRKATKFGERTGQLAGFKSSTFEETPVGNWKNFIRGVAGKNPDGTDIPDTEFNDRLLEMEALGQQVLRDSGIDDWYNVQGWTDIYGQDKIEQIAGFIASTSNNTSLSDNVRLTTEYLRRFIKNEDIVQPDYRLIEGGPTGVGFKVGMGEAGTVLNMEQGRVNNLKVSALGELDRISESTGNEKVKSFAQNLANVKDRATLDTYWAQISENPNRGIFTNTQFGVIGIKDYPLLEKEVARVAKERNPTAKNPTRKFSAEVWTGIRRKIAETGEFYGRQTGKKIQDEGNYNTVLESLIKEKAGFLDIPVAKFKQMLANGDANLLSLMLTSPIIYQAYQHYERDIEQPAIDMTTNPLSPSAMNGSQTNILNPSA